MGYYFIDQYSLLHFATGVIAYFFGISFELYNIIHFIFEIIENTSFGIKIINTYFGNIWPGGKNIPDSILNSIGDISFGAIGWYLAYTLDKLGNKYGVYPKRYIK